MRDVFQIINTPWPLLDSEDLKIYSIFLFVFGFVLGIIMSLLLTVIHYPNILFSMLAFTVGSFLMALLSYKRDWLDKKYGLVSRYHIGMNYSIILYIIFIITVTCSLLFFYPFLTTQGLQFALAAFISQYIPVVFMLLRLDVYSDDNCPVKKVDDFGNEYIENTLGYNPIIFYLISFPYSMLIAMPLSRYVNDILVSSYLTNNLIYLIISLAILFLLLSPDLLDKILPFDLRTWNGTGKFILLLVVILSILRYFLA